MKLRFLTALWFGGAAVLTTLLGILITPLFFKSQVQWDLGFIFLLVFLLIFVFLIGFFLGFLFSKKLLAWGESKKLGVRKIIGSGVLGGLLFLVLSDACLEIIFLTHDVLIHGIESFRLIDILIWAMIVFPLSVLMVGWLVIPMGVLSVVGFKKLFFKK